jgi:hypothetical protein
LHRTLLEFLGTDDLESCTPVVLEFAGVVDATADPHVLAVLKVKQALFGGPAERGTMPDRGAVQNIPSVEMGIEVEYSQGAMHGSGGPQQWQGDRVIAA